MEKHASTSHLIVLAHPNRKSFNASICEWVETLTRDSGYTPIVRDLYAMQFHPELEIRDFEAISKGTYSEDVQKEQSYIKDSRLITFIYPVWWTGMPALMKGYIDRVLSLGFAYGEKTGMKGVHGLLEGRQVVILNTCGTPKHRYEESGMLRSMKQTTDEGIFAFCGLEVVEHRFFGNIMHSSKEEREEHLKSLSELYKSLLPFR